VASGGTAGVAGTAGVSGTAGVAGSAGCTDSPIPPGGTEGCFGPYETEHCYSLAELVSLLRECAAPLGKGKCPPMNDLTGPYGYSTECSHFTQGPELRFGECCYTALQEGGVEGRPFTVGGEARTACVVGRGDWLGGTAGDAALSAPDPATRAALAESWLESARFEHASIASFARLTLQLLAHAAPANLIAASLAAAQDEAVHARLCFALGSRLAGSALGPAELPVMGALEACTLAELAAASVAEGCIGETTAALLAAAERDAATDPATRGALERIADDEARHAELSWRIVQWALRAGGRPVAQAVARAFAEAERSAVAAGVDAPGLDVAAWHAQGRLTAAERAAVVSATLRDVVVPCAALLLASAEALATARPDPEIARSPAPARAG
jgi:hypothetical protein